jgi:hypothetical protein
LIALNSLAVWRGRLVGFAKLGLEVDRRFFDLGGDIQVGYPHNILLNVTDTVRLHVSETVISNDMKGLTCPNDAKGTTDQVVNLPSYILPQLSRVEAGVAGSGGGSVNEEAHRMKV